MWALVFVAVLNDGTAVADTVDILPTMEACFEAREDVLVRDQRWDGHFELGTQAVCINLGD